MKTNISHTLLHEGLLELEELIIKARNKAMELQEDQEIDYCKEDLCDMHTDLNEWIAQVAKFIGSVAGYRFEKQIDETI
ncbi:hypothetical protein M2480_002055 [Parabacteroides sp. PFB2-12]|uniref:hypothetical protein n=1 Tax=unclassified Parabacteroides TaxID=2649774 RepID=UPI00247376A5|nr:MULTISPECIES: hypothetical protein [unclassified Parabacteroides]MDH6342919.1 hypothetical protein [Parabacteroides sp. PM6-13]MDH6391066.1 hypothetical protein [Parabacteroides sp. PFB2-12]